MAFVHHGINVVITLAFNAFVCVHLPSLCRTTRQKMQTFPSLLHASFHYVYALCRLPSHNTYNAVQLPRAIDTFSSSLLEVKGLSGDIRTRFSFSFAKAKAVDACFRAQQVMELKISSSIDIFCYVMGGYGDFSPDQRKINRLSERDDGWRVAPAPTLARDG